jgi:antitoxin (DNA-binding transcriptional repressor) of toxin-antitoxin stability system
MSTIPLEQADRALIEIVSKLSPGEEVVLTRGGEPVATIRAASASCKPRQFGTLSGSVLSIAPDVDDIPDGFEDHLP